MRGGRPLRFLALVLGGWISMRAVLLWPNDGDPPGRHPVGNAGDGPSGAVVRAAVHPAPAFGPAMSVTLPAPARASARVSTGLATAALHPYPARRTGMVALAVPSSEPAQGYPVTDPLHPAPPALSGNGPVALPTRPDGRVRTMVSFGIWALARPGAATGGPVQLGGGQAGARMRVPVTRGGRLALTARLSTPLAGTGREAAAGIEWRPFDAPVTLIAEQRVALDGGHGGTGIGVFAGLDRGDPSVGVALEAYGQTGAVARDRIEPYADGAVRGLRQVAATGRANLRIGVGAWGGAQRGAGRLDIGPTAVVAAPVGGQPVRLAIDWRQRIAGNADPGSGPAVTLGSDF